MASPSSAAPMSDVDPLPSSPGGHVQHEKSFMTTDANEDDDGKMAQGTPPPEPSEKSRGKKRSRDHDATPSQNGVAVTGKIRHLKKEDGEPLWRVDIQYDFLRAVFDNDEKVFTNSWEPEKPKQCFADLYIDTMARSSKTSKVLRDKLLSDRDAAKNMAMVCLLVNIGRMNTTLNFFPEMRAQLRTYHAIPSLQANADSHAYKQLQDAPRLKSILKGGAEDRPEPSTLEEIKGVKPPRTNPVNLLFVICQSAAKIAELHFPPGREFHDLIMKSNLSSSSRGRAFLWIMWFYLESDFTEEGCEENPFGAGVDYGVDVANQGVPALEELTQEEEAVENQDTPDELEYGEDRKRLRAQIIEKDQQFLAESQKRGPGLKGRLCPAADEPTSTATGILPRIRPPKAVDSDMDSVRSTPPPRSFVGKSGTLAANSNRRGGLKYQVYEASSPGGGPTDGVMARKPRPPTAHQLAVERNRMQRVDYILDQGLRRSHHRSRKHRKSEGALMRALQRLRDLPDPFDDSDSGEETHGRDAAKHPFHEPGYGGLVQLADEEDDFGEEFTAYTAALRRTTRRLTRWGGHEGADDLGVVAPVKRPREPNGMGVHEGVDDYDMMDDDDASPSKDPMIDPAETEDEAEIVLHQQTPQHSRRRPRKSPSPSHVAKRSSCGMSRPAKSARASLSRNAADDEEDRLAGLVKGPRRSMGIMTESARRAWARHSSLRNAADDEDDGLDEPRKSPSPPRVAKRSMGIMTESARRAFARNSSFRNAAYDEDDGLDDLDKSLLGMAEDDDEKELDTMEKTLLGIGGDSDSE